MEFFLHRAFDFFSSSNALCYFFRHDTFYDLVLLLYFALFMIHVISCQLLPFVPSFSFSFLVRVRLMDSEFMGSCMKCGIL